ncbi:MAG TPA: IS21-like element helper ATPase IstB [Bacteroidales bacterium]|nr:IS21-like element helper ATPase IstB [Bacteroidales bacterium]
MNEHISQIKQCATRLRLPGIGGSITDLIAKAERENPSYDVFIYGLLRFEVDRRDEKQLELRIKAAQLPLGHNLDVYDFAFTTGISPTQLNQLRELNWLEQCYNIMLTGPSGTGKTFIAAGLAHDAIRRGYKAYFRGMNDILEMLRLKDVSQSAAQEHKRLCASQLIVIDDVMVLAVNKEDGNRFFVFVNQIYESTSFIITTNKSPAEWAKSLDDEVLATALLDRLLYKCQLIPLQGRSYRMQNRKNIFK